MKGALSLWSCSVEVRSLAFRRILSDLPQQSTNLDRTEGLREEAKRIALECRNFPLDVGTEDTLNEIVNHSNL